VFGPLLHSTSHARCDPVPRMRSALIQDLRTARFEIAFTERAMTERNGRIARSYTISTISNNPNIARMRLKFGESWATNTGSQVSIAQIFSEIQSSAITSARPVIRGGIAALISAKADCMHYGTTATQRSLPSWATRF